MHYHSFMSLVYCIFATVIVCHILCSLMAFDCQEIKDYLLTYLRDGRIAIMFPSQM